MKIKDIYTSHKMLNKFFKSLVSRKSTFKRFKF